MPGIPYRLFDIPSPSTVSRFVKQLRNTFGEPAIERKRYEFPFANNCWQSEAMVGPHLLIDGKKLKVHLITFMDNASPLIVHSQFFFTENYLALEETLRQALLKRCIPKKIFVDNGKVYQSLQLRLICAKLGITLCFARPYSPISKGNIERFFRTFRNSFLSQLDISEISSLEQLNKLNTSYVESTYSQRALASNGCPKIACTPDEKSLIIGAQHKYATIDANIVQDAYESTLIYETEGGDYAV